MTAAGLTTTNLFYIAVNLMMVMGLAPVVAIPLHFMSYGGSSMLTIMMRSEEHTSELQSLMRISYAVFCMKKTTIPSPISSISAQLHLSLVTSIYVYSST